MAELVVFREKANGEVAVEWTGQGAYTTSFIYVCGYCPALDTLDTVYTPRFICRIIKSFCFVVQSGNRQVRFMHIL